MSAGCAEVRGASCRDRCASQAQRILLLKEAGYEWHLLKQYCYKKTYFRHSGAGRTKARSALNVHRAARRVSEANNPGNEAIDGDSWIPACAGMTVVLA